MPVRHGRFGSLANAFAFIVHQFLKCDERIVVGHITQQLSRNSPELRIMVVGQVDKIVHTAGFEWGAGFYINPTPPEQAAQYLREANGSSPA